MYSTEVSADIPRGLVRALPGQDSGGMAVLIGPTGNASNNPSISDPHLKGAIMVRAAQLKRDGCCGRRARRARSAHLSQCANPAPHIQAAWNDHGPTASTFLEAFYALKQGLPVVASAGWQSATRVNHLTHAQFLAAFSALEAAAPGQNLDRRIPSKGAVVVDYDLTRLGPGASRVADTSGNGYGARLEGGVLHTPLGSKGHNYTLLLRVRLSGTPGTLLSGPDDSFGVEALPGQGLTLAFTSSNITYLLSNYTLPSTSADTAVSIVLTGTEHGTSAFVDGAHAGDFLVSIDQTSVFEPMAFVAPVQTIGGGDNRLERFILWDGIQSETTI